ncbi:MAG: hypothetical protein KAX55_01500 [Propionivibrio sp.]|nr:hypothetical protein [Propionivibrio sp.]
MNLSLREAKNQATRLTARLKTLGVEIKRTQALEGVAAVHNFTDWNRMQASLAADDDKPVNDLSVAHSLIKRLKDCGVSLVGEDHLRTVLTTLTNASGSIDWQYQLHLTFAQGANTGVGMYVEEQHIDRISLTLRPELIHLYRYPSGAADLLLSQIHRVPFTPRAFVENLIAAGVGITKHDLLITLLESHGPQWIAELRHTIPTCRKNGVSFFLQAAAAEVSTRVRDIITGDMRLPPTVAAHCMQQFSLAENVG